MLPHLFSTVFGWLALLWRTPVMRRGVIVAALLLSADSPWAAEKEKEERGPKSPEAKVRVTGKGRVLAYTPGSEIVIQTEGGAEKGRKLKLAIPQGKWPHLGSVFFEVIFLPPKAYEEDFPVHSPMRPETLPVGSEVWYALEGVSADSLQLYQVACHLPTSTPAQFNAVVRNAVKLREARKQEEIARDYQCRLIESPKNPGNYPDDPALLERYVSADAIFPDRLDVKAPPPGHKGYGKGLKSSDVYANGVGAADRRTERRSEPK